MPLICMHVGAGRINEKMKNIYMENVRKLLSTGIMLLSNNKSSIEVVDYILSELEDSGLFNVGNGSSLTISGRLENDCSMMDGSTSIFSSALAIPNCIHTSSICSLLLQNVLNGIFDKQLLKPLILCGEEGLRYAKNNLHINTSDISMIQKEKWKEYISCYDSYKDQSHENTLVNKDNFEAKRRRIQNQDLNHIIQDTVGVIVIDNNDKLVLGTCSGGNWLKQDGRVGLAGIPGTGFWCTKDSACLLSGEGELLFSSMLCKDVCFLNEYLKNDDAKNQSIKSTIHRRTHHISGVNSISLGLLSVENNKDSFDITVYQTSHSFLYGYINEINKPNVYCSENTENEFNAGHITSKEHYIDKREINCL